MDVIISNSSDRIELNEMNSFGYWQAITSAAADVKGSALFDWLDDYDKLYGYTDKICLRVANPGSSSVDMYTCALL